MFCSQLKKAEDPLYKDISRKLLKEQVQVSDLLNPQVITAWFQLQMFKERGEFDAWHFYMILFYYFSRYDKRPILSHLNPQNGKFISPQLIHFLQRKHFPHNAFCCCWDKTEFLRESFNSTENFDIGIRSQTMQSKLTIMWLK